MLSDTAARWILVLHTVIGMATVATATHLVIWLRRYVRGQYGRIRAVRRFAALAFVFHLASFAAGNLVYPSYRIEVRAALLDSPGIIVADEQARARELERLAAREHTTPYEVTPTMTTVRQAAKMSRWFDVKEHWVALGLFASAGLVLLLYFWDARRDSKALAPIAMGLAVLVALIVWLGAIIGILTSAWRAV